MPKRKGQPSRESSSDAEDPELDSLKQARITGLSKDELRLILDMRKKEADDKKAAAAAEAEAQKQREADAARKKADALKKARSARKEVHKVGGEKGMYLLGALGLAYCLTSISQNRQRQCFGQQ